MLYRINGRSVNPNFLSATPKEKIKSNVKPTVCQECKGKGHKLKWISPPDLEEEDWIDWLKNLSHKKEKVTCGFCDGTGVFEHKFVRFESVKHETPKAILIIIGKKEIWVAKSIIAKQDSNVLVVPRWANLLTQEEWEHRRKLGWMAREEYEPLEWGFDFYEPDMFH